MFGGGVKLKIICISYSNKDYNVSCSGNKLNKSSYNFFINRKHQSYKMFSKIRI